ncbi:MAG TPA: transcriptional regulator [Bacteroidales bacterium]|nr:transcriptional regulator [Bacteroidales bacterium]
MAQQLDALDKQILSLVADNARIPFLEVARVCNVSGAAIHQRIQKLQQMGVLVGSEYVVDTYRIGFQTCAFVGIALSNVKMMDKVIEELKKIPQVVECHSITGAYSLLLKIYTKDNRQLMNLILDKISTINGVSHTETMHVSLNEHFRRQLNVFGNIPEEK